MNLFPIHLHNPTENPNPKPTPIPKPIPIPVPSTVEFFRAFGSYPLFSETICPAITA
jgi:hypothetical protein